MGNILTASDGTASHTYTYGDAVWQDKLTAYDGHAFAYDASGNPLSYYNGQSYAFTWQNGRELASATVGNTEVSYTYDLNGLRRTKTVNGVLHTYYYMGDRLVRETYGGNVLEFYYDLYGNPYALDHNGTVYYYILNLQGDVMALVDASGNEVAAYTYDPWGKVLSVTGSLASTLGQDNPIRYRSYYYDTDTSLYYLQSRYYDPTLCRFLNADSYMSTSQGIIGCNMYSYCNGNPILCLDRTGEWPLEFAWELLLLWLEGDGSPQYYPENSRISKLLKKSKKMKNYIDLAIEAYKNGEGKYVFTGTGEFTSEDGYELYLSTQHFNYKILVCDITETVDIMGTKITLTRYEAIVAIYDKYDFNGLNECEGVGNILNNMAYAYHMIGGGTDFERMAMYIYDTEWQISD